jgi:membrane-bound serine protease (ClpP class)
MRFFPGSWVERSFVLASRVGGHSGSGGSGGDGAPPAATAAPRFPPVGSEGTAVTDLYPSGRVEIDGRRYEARSALGPIEHGSRIRVQRTADFGVVVEEIPTKGGAGGPFEKGGLP